MTRKIMLTINTPTQRWLQLHGACAEGRCRVGRKSIGQYWHTCKHESDLVWLVRAFVSPGATTSLSTYFSGRWVVKHTREYLTRWMADNGIRIPGELL